MDEMEKKIDAACQKIICEWVFPGETIHTPDIDTQIRAEKLERMVLARMKELAAQGIDPTEMTLVALLPECEPDEIEVTEADYEAWA